MDIQTLNFSGHYEDGQDISEQLQLVVPSGDVEQAVLAWALLRHGETVVDEDSARSDYVFHYHLGGHIERGLYRLRLTARHRNGRDWHADIAAGLAATAVPETEERSMGFTPFWFISERLHFNATEKDVLDAYPGESFGRLEFERADALPHRRLFRATAAR